jgi:FMN reductase
VITTVLVGNPKAGSRTLEAATLVATALSGSVQHTIDLADFGAKLLDWSDADVAAAISTCAASDLLVVGSPTYKGSYTGLLKLFLDRIAGGTGLAGVVTVPVMLSANPAHALAPELLLKPVLVELGAVVPVQGLSLNDGSYAEPGALDPWLLRWLPTLSRLLPAAG